ncbi:MAG: tetratricopeptide repeat protein [Candidatus Hodarchaeota archaeon]
MGGEFQKVLDLVSEHEYRTDFSEEDKLVCSLLKSRAYYQLGKYQRTLQLLQRILDESRKIGNQILSIDALILKSTVLFRLGKYSDALNVIDQGEAILSRMKASPTDSIQERVAMFFYRRGSIYDSLGETDRESEYCDKALTIYKEIGHKEGIANCLNMKGNLAALKGDFSTALSFYKEALSLNREMNDLESTGMMLANIGFIYFYMGKVDLALEHFQEAKSIHEKMGNTYFLAGSLLQIGFAFSFKGNFNQALTYLQRSQNLFEEIDSRDSIAFVIGAIGLVYIDKGELTFALDNFQRSLEIFNEIGIHKGPYLSYFYRSIGRIYYVKGDYENALLYLKKGLALDEDIKNDLFISMSLYYICKVYIDMNLLEKSQIYAERLQAINEKRTNKIIEQQYCIINAIILKSSERTIKRAESQRILQELSKEQLFSIEFSVEVLVNLAYLLLDELKISGSEEILTEINICVDRLFEIAKTQHSYYLMCETYLLQSKLALLKFNTKKSHYLISQAELIAEEKGFGTLTQKITDEKTILQSIISKLELLVAKKPSITEVIELTHLESLFEKMLKKSIYRKQEEVLDYVAEAQALVQSSMKS